MGKKKSARGHGAVDRASQPPHVDAKHVPRPKPAEAHHDIRPPVLSAPRHDRSPMSHAERAAVEAASGAGLPLAIRFPPKFVILKLVFFALAMIVVPLASLFWARDNYPGDTTTQAIIAVGAVHVVLFSYVIVAFTENLGD